MDQSAAIHRPECLPPNRRGDLPSLFGIPMRTMALLILFLVTIDSLATIFVLRSGTGTEINPAMSWLIGHGEVPFLMTRVTLAGLCGLWLCWRAHHPYSRIAVVAALSIFMPVIGLHIYNQAFLSSINSAHEVYLGPQVVPLFVAP